MYKIGISGHRDLKEDKLPLYKEQIKKFLVNRKKEKGEVIAVSPLADGADKLFVQAAKELGIEYEVFLPMPKELYEIDFDESSQKEFEKLLKEAKVIKTASLCDGCTLENIKDYGEYRNKQYQKMGYDLVNLCDEMLFLFDGSMQEIKMGGTADVMFYAKDKGKLFVVIEVEREV